MSPGINTPLTVLVWVASFLLSAPALAQLDLSGDVQPTKRLALVIGNSDYVHHGTIRSSAEDARNATILLKKLGFQVFEASNVKNGAEFWNIHFLPFVSKINENDFVAFYFSGHGLSYGGENFLVTLEAEKEIPEDKAFDVLIPLSSLRDFFKTRSPGVSVFFLDACRTMAGSTIKRTDGRNEDIPKGPAQLSSTSQNVVIAFSSDFGTISKGRDELGKMSYFTEALVEYLGEIDKEFDHVRRSTRTRVLQLTGQTQVPWFSASSSGEIYFNPSQKIFDQEEIAWRSRKATNDWWQIWAFTLEYATSRFVAAAKKWLARNQARTAALTKVSPIDVHAAWSSDPKKLITVSRIDGPYAFGTIATAAHVSTTRSSAERPPNVKLDSARWQPKAASSL
jgi:hypothetical protein